MNRWVGQLIGQERLDSNCHGSYKATKQFLRVVTATMGAPGDDGSLGSSSRKKQKKEVFEGKLETIDSWSKAGDGKVNTSEYHALCLCNHGHSKSRVVVE